jgi:hypothetical protein
VNTQSDVPVLGRGLLWVLGLVPIGGALLVVGRRLASEGGGYLIAYALPAR